MMMLFALFFMFVGLIVFSLSMKRNFKQCYPQIKRPSLRLLFIFRLIGYLSLSISIYLCVLMQGLGLGLVIWFGAVTIASLLQVIFLTYRPQWTISSSLITLLCIAWLTGINV
ncbi:MAG: DUF3325 domain-containing protein [Colwellia sp.]|nr:DUF3325 domain-containing protein [Colwellia sp.]